MTWDAIVVGLGVMGAATLAELSHRGRRVLGLERFPLPHARGSSQGGTRIIREAYFEHPLYVPLVQQAYASWQALEQRTGRTLVVPTGGLTIGPATGRLVTGALASARTHGLAHEVLEARALARRHPLLRIPDDAIAVAEPRAGVVLAARAIAALLDVARADGATIRDATPVDGWDVHADGVHVTAGGETLRARRLVLAAGPWLPGLAPVVASLRVERNVVHWFEPADGSAAHANFGPDRLPVLVIEDAPDRLLYALPAMRGVAGDDVEEGVKFARHHGGATGAIDDIDQAPSPEDAIAIAGDVGRYLPALRAAPIRSAVCGYTNTADGHFLVDRHPGAEAVVLVSACSGHGFKFAPAIGAIAADLADGAAARGALPPFAFRAV